MLYSNKNAFILADALFFYLGEEDASLERVKMDTFESQLNGILTILNNVLTNVVDLFCCF